MKILILANDAVGLYQFRKELIEELLKENTVLISLPYGERVEKLKRMGCLFIQMPFERRSVNPFNDLRLLKGYFSLIKKQKPDLIITYTIKPNIYGGLVCRLRKIQYAVNITGLGTAFQKQGMLRRFVILMYKVSLKKAKVVFFENIENCRIFINEGIICEKQVCLLNGAGVNLKQYNLVEYPKNDAVTRFLFIGRVMKEKGIDELFDAMRLLQEEGIKCTLDVLGGCEEDYEERIRKYEGEGWLHYYGYQKDVRPFILNCHCFVLPSWHEGMANTNLESAAMGRPVITSDIHGCKEAVKNGISGYLIEKRNSNDLSIMMKKFVELSYNERKKMGMEGRIYMEEHFDKIDVVKKTINKLLDSMM